MPRLTFRTFKLEIVAENAAFAGDLENATDDTRCHEIAKMLRHLAARLEEDGSAAYAMLFDSNGNSCGDWKFVNSRER